MATGTASKLTTEYRAQQLALRADSIRELMTMWKAVDPTDLSGTIDVFSRAAAILIGRDHDRSAELGGQYFTTFRRAAGASARAGVVLAVRAPLAETQGLIRGSALTGVIKARRAGLSVRSSSDRGLIRAIGTLGKLVLTGGNNTIIGSVHEDRQALGWVRVTSADACAFCRLLSSRGPAYRSQSRAEFDPHDACACTAEPVYDDTPIRQSRAHLKEYRTAQAWARSTGNLPSGTKNDSLNAYRRWLAAGKPTP
jgi:hypothetical protein